MIVKNQNLLYNTRNFCRIHRQNYGTESLGRNTKWYIKFPKELLFNNALRVYKQIVNKKIKETTFRMSFEINLIK